MMGKEKLMTPGRAPRMIDLRTEDPISLQQALRLLPPRGRGQALHITTVLRWIDPGLNGVRLEAVRVGGRWVTTRAALDRFAAALTRQHEAAAAAS